MTNQISLEQVTDEIRQIYGSDNLQAEPLIEAFLERRLNELPAGERLTLLEELTAEFKGASHEISGSVDVDEEFLSRVFSLLLGRKVSQADLTSTEILERLAESLNTIFDTLNELVSVINTTLTGESTGEETIRQVIGFHVAGEDQTKSLESYLGQIKQAFLIAQQAFKNAAHVKVNQILAELDPERISEGGRGGLKFGPLRKAEFFEIYEENFGKVKKWFESGRFMDEFLREFEKNSQKLSLR
ncbi:MAG: hypothetical protein JW883_09545 [Deltaproteobacteria bacterium]|nr:hypothetical protein [Deltaproteobacteria bacterium]